MTPVFGHGHLRLYLLSLLDESPKHGYELIQALSERFGGTYSPSAGTIYPRLAKLEDEGLVTKNADGRKTVYSITDAGRAELESRRGDLDDIEAELSDSVRRLADGVRSGVDQAMRSLKAELASAKRQARAVRDAPGADARGDGAEETRAGDSASGGSASGGSASGDSTSGRSTTGAGTARAESAVALREADVALTEFRQQLRTDLRKASARGIDPELVGRLRERLAEVRLEVREELGRR
jgi:DNA-binding PadR family transcriptional regulator